jgi:hypothetical protein
VIASAWAPELAGAICSIRLKTEVVAPIFRVRNYPTLAKERSAAKEAPLFLTLRQ